MLMEARDHPIDKLYKRRDRFEIPDFQREEVWSAQQKQLLIDSILRCWKLPKLYLLKTGDKTYDVIDGQQRLAAIFEFMSDELELSDETAARYGGKRKYSEMDVDDTDPFDDFRLEFDEIEDATDEEAREFFKRLQAGTRLNGAERLNAVPSKLTDYAREIAGHEFFKNSVSFADKRYSYFDVSAKLSAIEIDGFETGLRVDELEKLFRSHKAFSKSSKVAQRIKSALDFLSKSMGKSSKNLRLRSMTQSLVNLTSYLQSYGLNSDKSQRFSGFVDHFMKSLSHQVDLGLKATDADYLAFQRTVNSNTKSGAKTRHAILLRKLFEFDPSMLAGLDAPLVAVAGVESTIISVSNDIHTLIAEINDLSSAKTGKNIFKPTNKTIVSQHAIGKSVKSADDFNKVVESLYFLFWEGPGDKLDPKPESFKRVNVLRTELQHDVDHGKASAVAKKKKAAADTLSYYAGIPTTIAAGVENLQIGQMAILNDIKKDLALMKADFLK